MKKLLLLCVLAVAVGGCSPSEKSIQKAAAKGDYLYVEKYLNNPKYWNDPNKYATNAAALEALILLNRIDSAVKIYKENKQDISAEKKIANAFVNGLKKSNLQKMPEKIVELINDDRNNDSDVLLRSAAVELEPSIIVTKVKTYIEQAINGRKREDSLRSAVVEIAPSIEVTKVKTYPTFLKKAEMWDMKNTYRYHIKVIKNSNSELDRLNELLTENNSKLESRQKSLDEAKNGIIGVDYWQHDISRNQKHLNDLYARNPYNYNLVVIGCLQMYNNIEYMTEGKQTPYSACRETFIERLKEVKESLKEKQKEIQEIQTEIKDIEKDIPDNVSQVNAKQTEVETAEANLTAALGVASQESK